MSFVKFTLKITEMKNTLVAAKVDVRACSRLWADFEELRVPLTVLPTLIPIAQISSFNQSTIISSPGAELGPGVKEQQRDTVRKRRWLL